MLALLQRVESASVLVEGQQVGAIGPGLLVYLGFAAADKAEQLQPLLQRVVNYRIFPDAAGKMNLSLSQQSQPQLLLVPQFTLCANTRKGLRPNFISALAPALAAPMFEQALAVARSYPVRVEAGSFGAHMLVEARNDGPINFLLASDSSS